MTFEELYNIVETTTKERSVETKIIEIPKLSGLSLSAAIEACQKTVFLWACLGAHDRIRL